MIQKMIKKVLRKWLKKKVYSSHLALTTNIARFEWVYNSPLKEWRDRIWIVRQHSKTIAGIGPLNQILSYL